MAAIYFMEISYFAKNRKHLSYIFQWFCSQKFFLGKLLAKPVSQQKISKWRPSIIWWMNMLLHWRTWWLDGSLHNIIHAQQPCIVKSMRISYSNFQVWDLSNMIENLSVIPTNSNSTAFRRISRELYHSSLKVQGHKEELPSPGTLH